MLLGVEDPHTSGLTVVVPDGPSFPRRRETQDRSIQMEFTCGIDDEAIELEAMNRLQDGSIKLHLANCDRCQGRVSEHRNWIGVLTLALNELREAQERQETPPDNSYGSSPGSGA